MQSHMDSIESRCASSYSHSPTRRAPAQPGTDAFNSGRSDVGVLSDKKKDYTLRR
jgi:hypothetical protein